MSVKKLVQVWDGNILVEDNINFLKCKTKSVLLPISDNIQNILNDLLHTYQATPCAGLAANQIGYDKSIFIGLKDDFDNDIDDKEETTQYIGNPHADNYEFYINPQIIHCSKKSIQEGEEGCLSIPEIRIIAERFDKIKVKYYNQEGMKIQKPLSGFMSRLFQHELDHLNGILMVENIKIKNIYNISENDNLGILYNQLVQKVLQ